MKSKSFILLSFLTGASLLLSSCGKSDSSGGAAESVGADGIRMIRITGNDALQYNLKEISAAPGEKLKIELSNIGKMPKETMSHNWVLVKSMSDGELNAFAMAASTKPPQFLPDDQAPVIAHTKMLGPGEKETIEVIAPAAPGSYPFICTFPGHFALMKGNLIVKAK